MIAKGKTAVVAGTVALILCVLAVFSWFGGQVRTIAGDYRLEQWEDFQTYYLHKRGQDDSSGGGSIIGGTVLRLGWNNRYIVAKRRSFYSVDPSGWMIIDVKSGIISGPFTEAEFHTNSEAQGIHIYEVGEAWKRL